MEARLRDTEIRGLVRPFARGTAPAYCLVRPGPTERCPEPNLSAVCRARETDALRRGRFKWSTLYTSSVYYRDPQKGACMGSHAFPAAPTLCFVSW